MTKSAKKRSPLGAYAEGASSVIEAGRYTTPFGLGPSRASVSYEDPGASLRAAVLRRAKSRRGWSVQISLRHPASGSARGTAGDLVRAVAEGYRSVDSGRSLTLRPMTNGEEKEKIDSPSEDKGRAVESAAKEDSKGEVETATSTDDPIKMVIALLEKREYLHQRGVQINTNSLVPPFTEMEGWSTLKPEAPDIIFAEAQAAAAHERKIEQETLDLAKEMARHVVDMRDLQTKGDERRQNRGQNFHFVFNPTLLLVFVIAMFLGSTAAITASGAVLVTVNSVFLALGRRRRR